jgi:hypothetical protein
MFTKKSPLALFVGLIVISQLACNLGANQATPDTFATLNGLYTASALTLETEDTPGAPTFTPGLPPPTVSETSAVAPTLPVSQTPAPISRCDAIQFLGDVTHPDGSSVARNNDFDKIWKLKNVGTCSWTPSYALVFVSGDPMNGPSAVSLPRNVNPGETIELSVTLTAPNKGGTYRGYWKLRNASGVLFGFGAQADTAFWVDIKVRGAEYVAYNFVNNYCEANWQNNDGAIPCPGDDDDEKGFAIKLNAPVMENGVTEDEPGLFTLPQNRNNGIISGQYPAFTVKTGDRFRTIVSCEYESPKCNVIFRLDYKNNGKLKNLASWHEIYEGKSYPVDLDLSPLAGETVKFILVVSANGAQKGDHAIWLNPHIVRQGDPPPTPTPTPTSTFTQTPTPTPTLTFTHTFTPTPTPTPTDTPIP